MNFNKLVEQILNEDNVGNIDELVGYAVKHHFMYNPSPLYTQWFVRELKRFVAQNDLNLPVYQPNDTLPSWAKGIHNLKKFDANHSTLIIDFCKKAELALKVFIETTPNADAKLLKKSFEQLIQLADNALVEGRDIHTVMKFDNSMRWVKLLSAFAFDLQGYQVGNCMDSSMFYKSSQESRKPNTISGHYSLFKGVQPKVTLAVNSNNVVYDLSVHSHHYNEYIVMFFRKYKLTHGVSDARWSPWNKQLIGHQSYEDYLDEIGFDRSARLHEPIEPNDDEDEEEFERNLIYLDNLTEQ